MHIFFSEKLKSLNISAIVLPPRVIVGKKGRITISVEGRLAERVQTAWFLNDVPITDTSYKGIRQLRPLHIHLHPLLSRGPFGHYSLLIKPDE